MLPPELAFQQDIRERFTREAQTAARLSHPHIVPIHTVGEGQGLVYFVMGYVDGESVAARIRRRGRLPVEEVRRIMKETADALSAAHALSVIHRDIKPDNILLEGTRGRVMVTDFGIAKALSTASGATLTGIGVAIGTPAFMSPEQAAGERKIDGRSDLYSLGVVTYQMLTGELPFSAPSVAGILMKQITEPAPDLRHQAAGHPGGSGPGGRPLPGEGSGEPLAHCRCAPPGAGEPVDRRPDISGAAGEPGRRDSGQRGGTGNRRGRRARRSRGAARGRCPAPPQRPRRGRPAVAPRPARAAGDSGKTGNPFPTPASPRSSRRCGASSPAGRRCRAGCPGINVATGIEQPWFLFPDVRNGDRLAAELRHALAGGYSWRDVLSRPPAPDAIETTQVKAGEGARQLPAPTADEYGAHLPSMLAGARRPAGDPQADVQAAGLGAEDAAGGPADGGRAVRPGHRPRPARCTRWTATWTPRGWRRSTSGSPALVAGAG